MLMPAIVIFCMLVFKVTHRSGWLSTCLWF